MSPVPGIDFISVPASLLSLGTTAFVCSAVIPAGYVTAADVTDSTGEKISISEMIKEIILVERFR